MGAYSFIIVSETVIISINLLSLTLHLGEVKCSGTFLWGTCGIEIWFFKFRIGSLPYWLREYGLFLLTANKRSELNTREPLFTALCGFKDLLPTCRWPLFNDSFTSIPLLIFDDSYFLRRAVQIFNWLSHWLTTWQHLLLHVHHLYFYNLKFYLTNLNSINRVKITLYAYLIRILRHYDSILISESVSLSLIFVSWMV